MIRVVYSIHKTRGNVKGFFKKYGNASYNVDWENEILYKIYLKTEKKPPPKGMTTFLYGNGKLISS